MLFTGKIKGNHRTVDGWSCPVDDIDHLASQIETETCPIPDWKPDCFSVHQVDHNDGSESHLLIITIFKGHSGPIANADNVNGVPSAVLPACGATLRESQWLVGK